MDFSKFRASGDLSDLVVVVDGVEHHLHRFPLYAKSEFFCSLARTTPALPAQPVGFSKSRVELRDFPGGRAVFGLVADFCYNMAPRLTRDNVVPLRCAAARLQMEGPANLGEVADKFLQDAVSAARLSRAAPTLVAILTHCAAVGRLAQELGLVSLVTDGLADVWARSPASFTPTSSSSSNVSATHASAISSSVGDPPSAFTARQGSAFKPMKSSQVTPVAGPPPNTSEEDCGSVSAGLCKLPEDWFASLLAKALDKGVRQATLAELAVRYVTNAIDNDAVEGNKNNSNINNSRDNRLGADNDQDDADRDGDDDAPDDLDKEVDTMTAGNRQARETAPVTRNCDDRQADLGAVLDAVLTVLPEDAYCLPDITVDWLTKVLRLATQHGCRCRGFLVAMAADKLARLSPEDLCCVSPSLLHDVSREARDHESQQARACALVDTYLGQMAEKGVLTAETYRLLASALPPSVRRNHDKLYSVLEYVLTAEKDSLNEELRQELLQTVDLSLVSEETLRSGLDSNLLTPEPVARAALKLCADLRSELESVKYIATMQEEELAKLQALTAPSPDTSPRSQAYLPPAKLDSDSGFSDVDGDAKADPSQHVRAAQSVLSSARSRLAMPLYAGHRPYLPTSTDHHDLGLQEEGEFRERGGSTYRSLEPRVRSRHLLPAFNSSPSSSSSSHHRSLYFPYSPRY